MLGLRDRGIVIAAFNDGHSIQSGLARIPWANIARAHGITTEEECSAPVRSLDTGQPTRDAPRDSPIVSRLPA
jgi:hypothetical protein